MRNRSLAQSLAKSSLIPAVVAIGLLAGSIASAADPVYHWKDSNGQSHYSQQPPEKGIKYETISASGAPASAAPAAKTEGGVTAPPAKATTGAPAGQTPADAKRQQQCEAATKNVDILANRPLVEMDINGTGTPKRLTPQEQTAQLEHFKTLQTAFCVK
jgi:hypothetical protein